MLARVHGLSTEEHTDYARSPIHLVGRVGLVGIHVRTHPSFVEGCAPCRWSSIGLANWARSEAGERQILTGLMNEAEIDGYKALRDQGIQPRGTRWPDLVEARYASEARDEPYDAGQAPLDPSKDWGDGGGHLDLAPAPLEGREPETVTVSR